MLDSVNKIKFRYCEKATKYEKNLPPSKVIHIFLVISGFLNFKSLIYLVCHDRKPKRSLIINEIILKVWIVFQGSVVDCDKGL